MMMMNEMHSKSLKALQKSINYKSIGASEAAAGVMADILLAVSKTPEDTMTLDFFSKDDTYDMLEDLIEQIGQLEISAPEQLKKLTESVATIMAGLVVVSEIFKFQLFFLSMNA